MYSLEQINKKGKKGRFNWIKQFSILFYLSLNKENRESVKYRIYD